MEKKILKAMYTYIASKDPVRPTLCGVFFDKDAIVATDTHMLVKYKTPGGKFAGKILDANGEEIKGQFPDYNRVIPTGDNLGEYIPRVNLEQLQKACAWFTRKVGFNANDCVCIEGKSISIKYLSVMLNVLLVADDIKTAVLHKTSDGRPAVITSKKFDMIIMPHNMDQAKVDEERAEDCPVVLSLENLINQFVFEGWKKQPTDDPMGWLD